MNKALALALAKQTKDYSPGGCMYSPPRVLPTTPRIDELLHPEKHYARVFGPIADSHFRGKK
jgi:hypothetical protein